jgi:DNA-binding response OmpR family regulator
MNMHHKPLANCRIFYLEDDFYIAQDTRERLAGEGAEVVLTGNVSRALDALQDNSFDVALLDINISGSSSVPVARSLREAGVPILFLTGYARDILPSDLSSCALLTKPLDWPPVVQALQGLLGRCAPEEAFRARSQRN